MPCSKWQSEVWCSQQKSSYATEQISTLKVNNSLECVLDDVNVFNLTLYTHLFMKPC